MCRIPVTEDYYAVLELSQTATDADIKKSYRRLAILRHPDKNQNDPTATACFQTLNRAHEILADGELRSVYDLSWESIVEKISREMEKANREAEAAKAKEEKLAREKAEKEAEERRRREAILELETKRRWYENQIIEVTGEIARLLNVLKDIQKLEDVAARDKEEKDALWMRAKSFLLGTGTKEGRDRERLERFASKRKNEAELLASEDKLKVLNSYLSALKIEIRVEKAAENERFRNEERAKARAKQEEARRAMHETFEESREREQAERAQAAASRRAQRQSEEQSERQTEQWQKLIRHMTGLEAEERRRKQAEEKEARKQKSRRAGESKKEQVAPEARQKASARKPQSALDDDFTPEFVYSENNCDHRGHWKIEKEGNLLCDYCDYVQYCFVFQCHGCLRRACGSCRAALKPTG